MILALAACAMPGPFGRPEAQPDLVPPILASYELGCVVDDAQWTLAAEATSWTGGGTSFWTADFEYFEEHVADTVAYEPDGSGESLLAEIGIVADWRLKGPRNTAFTCADEVDVIFQLYDLDGDIVDCRTTGPDPALWANVAGVPPCPASNP